MGLPYICHDADAGEGIGSHGMGIPCMPGAFACIIIRLCADEFVKEPKWDCIWAFSSDVVTLSPLGLRPRTEPLAVVVVVDDGADVDVSGVFLFLLFEPVPDAEAPRLLVDFDLVVDFPLLDFDLEEDVVDAFAAREPDFEVIGPPRANAELIKSGILVEDIPDEVAATAAPPPADRVLFVCGAVVVAFPRPLVVFVVAVVVLLSATSPVPIGWT
jgi:hypothetical protein